MDFNDTSTSQAIVQDVYFLTETNSTSYATADIVRNGNRWAYKAVVWIIKANKKWQFDDSNFTTNPILDFDLVNGQQSYGLPVNLLKLVRVEVKDTSGTYHQVLPLDESQIPGGLTNYMSSAGLPKYYDIQGDSLFFYPPPSSSSVTTTAGGALHVLREIDVFAAADTTQEPGFAEPFHRIVSLGASYDYFIAKGNTSSADRMLRDIETLKTELTQFYSDRDGKTKVRVEPIHRQHEYL